jgi:phosphatidylglycerophosphate synthase
VSPAVITALAFVAGIGSAGAAARGATNAALVLWILNRILDGLDGAHARMHGRDTPFGAYLDIVLDFVVYAAIPIGIAFHAGTRETAFAALVLVASFYANAASWMYLAGLLERRHEGAAARGEVTALTMPAGLVDGTETVAFYVAFFLWPTYHRPLFYVMAALVATNVLIRLVWAKRHL